MSQKIIAMNRLISVLDVSPDILLAKRCAFVDHETAARNMKKSILTLLSSLQKLAGFKEESNLGLCAVCMPGYEMLQAEIEKLKTEKNSVMRGSQ